MWKRIGTAVAAVALATTPVMAWEPAPLGEASVRTTITTVADIGPTFIIVAEALPADCPLPSAVFGPIYRDRDAWLGFGTAVMDNPSGEVVARFLSLAMFARAQNARVRITIGGAAANSRGCFVTNIMTCFDANNCALPPAP